MHQQTRKERLVQFDILKGIGIILVIIGHTSLSGYPKSLIYGFHMPLFFFCSGVFYKDKPFAEVLVKSFKQLIVPYFFFLVVWNWVNMAVNLHGADMHTYLGVLRQNINILDEKSYWYKTIWFLPCLFSVRILYAIISGKVKNRIWHACIGGGYLSNW